MNPLKTLRHGALFAWLALAGCNQLLGIEVQDQTGTEGEDDGGPDEDDAGNDAGVEYENPSTAECKAYCDQLDESCNPMTGNAAFATKDYCPGVCSHMQRTKDKSKTGNTFDCRVEQADHARAVGVIDNGNECKAAGAGGDGTCGTNCESYCQLYAEICAAFPALQRNDTCVTECEALAVDATKNAAASFNPGGDTLQCRLAHMGAATISESTAMTHCPHAAIIAPAGSPCQPNTPSCDQYCALVTNTCTGKMLQYDSKDDCLATCRNGLTLSEMLAPEETSDQTRDTVACRRYHTYNALQNPTGVHCQHAGPSGDGHCGRVCPAYCKLAKAACNEKFNAKYPKGDSDCLAECGSTFNIPNPSDQIDLNYNVPNAKKAGTLNCRIYHATKAFRSTTAASAECPSVLGEGECAN